MLLLRSYGWANEPSRIASGAGGVYELVNILVCGDGRLQRGMYLKCLLFDGRVSAMSHNLRNNIIRLVLGCCPVITAN